MRLATDYSQVTDFFRPFHITLRCSVWDIYDLDAGIKRLKSIGITIIQITGLIFTMVHG